jgi:hypothetical protein
MRAGLLVGVDTNTRKSCGSYESTTNAQPLGMTAFAHKRLRGRGAFRNVGGMYGWKKLEQISIMAVQKFP